MTTHEINSKALIITSDNKIILNSFLSEKKTESDQSVPPE